MTINAGTETFDLIDAAGQAVLFTPFQVDRNSVPEDLYCYDLRVPDREDDGAVTVERHVVCGHLGTILCKKPFDLGKEGKFVLSAGLSFLSASAFMLDDYRTWKQKQNQPASQTVESD